MRILITNNRLDLRGGAETFVRDLARSLQDRGHEVMVYSSDPGRRARLLEHDAIPVTTEPQNLPWRPDLIHGQHHLDAMTALAALPEVPALYYCHGAVWKETQPLHPRIHRYVTVSRTLKQRLVTESNIDPERIHVVLNCIDLQRFPTVRQPPANIRRVLFYNGHHRPNSATVGVVREACARMGWQVEFVGVHFGRIFERPENELPKYHLVFASGRSAIDAMACGCAVAVLGRNGCGPLVDPSNFPRLREVNFSMATNHPPPGVDELCAHLASYSAGDTEAVSRKLRIEADAERMTDQLLDVYARVLQDHATSTPDAQADLLAMGAYLRNLTPLIKLVDDQHRREMMHLTKVQAVADLQQSLQAALAELRNLPPETIRQDTADAPATVNLVAPSRPAQPCSP